MNGFCSHFFSNYTLSLLVTITAASHLQLMYIRTVGVLLWACLAHTHTWYTNTHVHTYTHVHIYTYTHIHAHACTHTTHTPHTHTTHTPHTLHTHTTHTPHTHTHLCCPLNGAFYWWKECTECEWARLPVSPVALCGCEWCHRCVTVSLPTLTPTCHTGALGWMHTDTTYVCTHSPSPSHTGYLGYKVIDVQLCLTCMNMCTYIRTYVHT